LKGTIVLPGSTANQAIMAAPGETEKVYVVGDRIADGAEVVEILPDRAVLRRQDRLEILRLSGTTLSASVSTMADPSPADDIDDITETDLGEVRAAIKIHPEMVLSLVEAEPTVENGQLRGFRVMPATDAVFMALLGLQPGDILSAINGILLDGEDRGQEQLRALAGASAFTFSVWRGDRPQLLTYNAAG
jgi:general secretion pathway protein C